MHLECDRTSKGFLMSSFTAPPFAVPATLAQRGSRRQILTALIAAAPVVLTVAVFIHPNDTDDAAETLARIAGADRARWITAHLLESFALLTMAVVLTLVGWAAIAIALTPVLMLLVGGSVSAQVAALVGGVPMIVGLAGSAKPVATAWSGPR